MNGGAGGVDEGGRRVRTGEGADRRVVEVKILFGVSVCQKIKRNKLLTFF